MRQTTRLDRAVLALDGRERAIMFLRAYKTGNTLDPNGVQFLHPYESKEYEALIDVIRLCNDDLATVIAIASEQLKQENLRFGCLEVMRIAADDLWMIGQYLKECVPEPITESELKTGKRRPPGGWDVRPDEDADEVALLRENRKLIETLVSRGARLKLPLDIAAEVPADPKRFVDKARLIARIVRDAVAVHWRELRAIDELVAEYGERFEGEDPLRPEFRRALDAGLERCQALRAELCEFIGEWALSDDHSTELDQLRTIAKRILE